MERREDHSDFITGARQENQMAPRLKFCEFPHKLCRAIVAAPAFCRHVCGQPQSMSPARHATRSCPSTRARKGHLVLFCRRRKRTAEGERLCKAPQFGKYQMPSLSTLRNVVRLTLGGRLTRSSNG